MIKLIEMNEVKFKDFARLTQSRRKKYYMDSFLYSELDAAELAKNDFDRILVDGFSTKDNYTYNIIDDAGKEVGYIWYTIRNDGKNHKAFICDILVRKEFRGHGFGRRALVDLEEQVKSMGLNKIGLHVFAVNTVAVGLYKSMGYEVNSYLMDKEIR